MTRTKGGSLRVIFIIKVTVLKLTRAFQTVSQPHINIGDMRKTTTRTQPKTRGIDISITVVGIDLAQGGFKAYKGRQLLPN
jgi:hypothetical protein